MWWMWVAVARQLTLEEVPASAVAVVYVAEDLSYVEGRVVAWEVGVCLFMVDQVARVRLGVFLSRATVMLAQAGKVDVSS